MFPKKYAGKQRSLKMAIRPMRITIRPAAAPYNNLFDEARRKTDSFPGIPDNISISYLHGVCLAN